jgi:hypothetical protein
MGTASADILRGLLWRQCLLAAIVTVPTAAIAAATRNLAQFLFAALAIGAAIVTLRESLIEHWTGPWWIRPAGLLVVTLGAAAALRILYSRRDTMRARVVLGAAAALFVAAMFTNADHFTPIRIVTGPPQVQPDLSNALQASIRLEGAPPTADVFVDGHTVSASASIRDYADGRGVLVIGLGDNIPTFRFAGRLELTLYTPQGSISPPEDMVQIPGMGVCATRQDVRGGYRNLICFSPRPGLALAARSSYGRMEWIVPPGQFELPNPFDSADIYGSRGDYPAQIIPARVLARVRGHFDLTGARP